MFKRESAAPRRLMGMGRGRSARALARHGALAAMATMGLVATTGAAAAAPAIPDALWLNPFRSVVVRTGPCGERLCGWVAWANAKAEADAREHKIERLVGTMLLENYRPSGATTWRGTLYVPDMDSRFSSEIALISPNEMKVKGCILGGLFCKSQIWTRVTELPRG